MGRPKGSKNRFNSLVKTNCKTCGKVLFLAPYKLKRGKSTFCSIKCYGKAIKGIKRPPRSIKHRRNLSIARRKQKPPMLGKKPSLQHRLSLSKAQKGSKSNNWKGGLSTKAEVIRKSIHIRLWREAVFARDNWTCRICKKRGWILNAHHIKSFAKYPKLMFAIDNGMTLCKECHQVIHRKTKRII